MLDRTAMDMVKAVTDRLCSVAVSHAGIAAPHDAALGTVTRYLPRLLDALAAGLVTEREVAGAIAGRFEDWLMESAGRGFPGAPPSWTVAVDEVEAILRTR